MHGPRVQLLPQRPLRPAGISTHDRCHPLDRAAGSTYCAFAHTYTDTLMFNPKLCFLLLATTVAHATPRIDLLEVPPLRILPEQPATLTLEFVNRGSTTSPAGTVFTTNFDSQYRLTSLSGPCGSWNLIESGGPPASFRRQINLPPLTAGEQVRCAYRVEEVAGNQRDEVLVLSSADLPLDRPGVLRTLVIGRFADVKASLILLDTRNINGSVHRRYRATFQNMSDENIVDARFSQCRFTHNPQTANQTAYSQLAFASISCPRAPEFNDCETLGVPPPAIFSTQIPPLPPRGASQCELVTVNQTPAQTLNGFQIERDLRTPTRRLIDSNPFDNVFIEGPVANAIQLDAIHGHARWLLPFGCMLFGLWVLARRSS